MQDLSCIPNLMVITTRCTPVAAAGSVVIPVPPLGPAEAWSLFLRAVPEGTLERLMGSGLQREGGGGQQQQQQQPAGMCGNDRTEHSHPSDGEEASQLAMAAVAACAGGPVHVLGAGLGWGGVGGGEGCASCPACLSQASAGLMQRMHVP